MTADSVKGNSFSSVKSLPDVSISMCFQSSFVCVISSFNFCPIAALLVNAVNFQGTTRPFSSSFRGT